MSLCHRIPPDFKLHCLRTKRSTTTLISALVAVDNDHTVLVFSRQVNDAMSSLKSIAAQAVESAGIPQPAQQQPQQQLQQQQQQSGASTSQSTTLSQPDNRGTTKKTFRMTRWQKLPKLQTHGRQGNNITPFICAISLQAVTRPPPPSVCDLSSLFRAYSCTADYISVFM